MQNLSPNSSIYKSIGGIVDQVYNGQIPDPTNGATHYYGITALYPPPLGRGRLLHRICENFAIKHCAEGPTGLKPWPGTTSTALGRRGVRHGDDGKLTWLSVISYSP